MDHHQLVSRSDARCCETTLDTVASRRRRRAPSRRGSRRRSGPPAGQPSIASSRSHWFTTECRRRSVARPRHGARIHPRPPGDLVADSLRRPREPRQPRAARPAVEIDHEIVTLPPQAAPPAASRRRFAPPSRAAAPRSPRPGADSPGRPASAGGSTRYVRCASGNVRFNARSIGVVNTTSPIRRRRINRIFNAGVRDPGPGIRRCPDRFTRSNEPDCGRIPDPASRIPTGALYGSIVASSISMTGMSSLMG